MTRASTTSSTASAPTARPSFVSLPVGDFSAAARLALIASSGGETRYPEAGTGHLDGPEYSPDGAWLYVNTEAFAKRPGHAQLARVPADGGRLEQLVESTPSIGSRADCERRVAGRSSSARGGGTPHRRRWRPAGP